ATIAEVLEGPLRRWSLTVSELIHRSDAVERLERAGMDLQHAIQKVAVAQSTARGQPVQAVVKKLNGLVEQATEKLHADHQAGFFAPLDKAGLAGLAKKLRGKTEIEYRLRGSVALALKEAGDWSKKFNFLLALIQTAPPTGEERAVSLAAIDTFIAEMLTGRSAMRDLLGERDDLGAALTDLVEILVGEAPKSASIGVKALTEQFCDDMLPAANRALVERLLHELKRGDRLKPNDIAGEVRLVRKLASRIVEAQGQYLSIDEITDAFSHRSRRLLSPESIDELLADVPDPVAQLEKLLMLEENIVGAENRRRLAEFIVPQITANKMEAHFVGMKESVGRRLQRISAFVNLVEKSDFHESSKADIVRALDELAVRVDEQTGFLDAIAKQKAPTSERVLALLRLCAHGVLVDGECAMRAKRKAITLMRDPSFMQGLVKTGGSDVDPALMLAEMKQLLAATGLNGPMASAKPSAAANKAAAG
ncbi:MAG: hypothetical protein AAGH48_06920, partial [Pseudomonadota bacterium]